MFRLKYLPHREPNEKIIFFLHRHTFVLWRSITLYIVGGIIPIVAYFIIKEELASFTSDTFLIFLRLLLITFYLFWWLMIYHAWLDYFLDIWIVTNRRVLNIEQRGLFNRTIGEHKLFRIQDVMSEQKGMLPTFFDYGEIHIQTAASEKIVEFKQVPKPHKVAREIIKLIENLKKIMAKIMSAEGGSPGGDKIDKAEGID